MPTFNKIIKYIGNLTKTIIIVPHPIAIGNYCEEIYFGLLRARLDNKKLIIVQPYQMPGLLRLKLHNNKELLSLNSEYISKFQTSIFFPLVCWIITLYFSFFRAINIILGKFFNKTLSEKYTIPMLGQDQLWQPHPDCQDFLWEAVEKFNWDKQVEKKLLLSLSKAQIIKATKLRRELGLPSNAWYVCLHVREGGYYGDQKEAANRNANILNYIDAIMEITRRGGWVVRMGDSTMTRLPDIPMVIDYPFSFTKCALMDIYLVKECALYIGMQSGILDLAMLFQRPILTTNMITWLITFPLKSVDAGLFKRVYSKDKKRYLHPNELPAIAWGGHTNFSSPDKYEFHENSPKEILDFVIEYLERTTEFKPKYAQMEFNAIRVEAGKKILSKKLIDGDIRDDITSRYRLASRLRPSIGVLSWASLRTANC